MSGKKLMRSRKDRMIFGVAGGLGKYLDIDSTVVRLLFVLLVAAGGSGFFIYIVLAFVVPLEDDKEDKEYDFSERVNKLSDELKESKVGNDPKNFLGILLLLIGATLLLRNIFPWTVVTFGLIWPLIIILFGLYILMKR